MKDKTKTLSSCREIPLTRAAQQILKDVAAFNAEHGYTAEWIFQSDNHNFERKSKEEQALAVDSALTL